MSNSTATLSTAVRAQQRLSLEVLQRFGPLTLDAIPRAWPLTREQVATVVADLADRGAISYSWDILLPGRKRVALTENGERMLRTLSVE